MITLGIQNFQSVRTYQEVSLGGISLLYGENSSGKSIIKNALEVLSNINEHTGLPITTNDWFNHQAKSSGEDLLLSVTFATSENYAIQINDGSNTFLAFHEILERTTNVLDDSNILISNELTPVWEKLISHFRTSTMQVLYTWRWRGRAELACIEVKSTTNSQSVDMPSLLNVTFSDNGQIAIHFNLKHPVVMDLLHSRWELDVELEDLVIEKSYSQGDFEHLFSALFSGLVSETIDLVESCGNYRLAPLLSLTCLSIATDGVSQHTDTRVIDAVRTVTEKQYRATKPTSPGAQTSWNEFNANYWHQFKTLLIHNLAFDGFDKEKVEQINNWLTKEIFLNTDYELDVDIRTVVSIGTARDLKGRFEDSVNILADKAADNIKTDEDTVAKYSTLMLRDKQSDSRVQFENVGSGMAFVLPILHGLSFSTHEWLLYIQEPELHLHPKMQAGLAEVVADAYKQSGKNRIVILETHSELFALRILKLIRTNDKVINIRPTGNLTPNDVNFTAVYKDKNGHTLYKAIRVSRSGEFLDSWPNGFFQEQERELFE